MCGSFDAAWILVLDTDSKDVVASDIKYILTYTKWCYVNLAPNLGGQ